MAWGARLFLKGQKDPVELTEKEGQEIQKLLDSDAIRNTQRISFAGISALKQDIRFIRPYKVADVVVAKEYTREDLVEFQKEIEPYFMKKGDPDYERILTRLVSDITKKVKPSFYVWEVQVRIKALQEQELLDVEIQERAEKIMEDFFIGRLYQGGEDRYLIDKKAIKLTEGGYRIIIQNRDGSIPAISLMTVIDLWKEEKARHDYGRRLELKELDSLAATMNVQHEAEQDAQ